MSTKIGVGESKSNESFKAGAQAAQTALKKAGIEKCDFVFMFATTGFDQEELLEGVRSVTGDAPLSGCSGEGIITQSGPEGEILFSLSGNEKGNNIVGVMVLSSDDVFFYNCAETGLKENSIKTGEEIGKKINEAMPENPLVLLMFPDAYSVNMRDLFSGIENKLKTPLLFAGGLSAHNLPSSNITFQYFNGQVLKNSVACVLISGDAKIELGVSHGGMPIGIEKTVTKAKANTVFEIDNRTTWSFFKQYLGEDEKDLNSENSPFISIGEKLPEGMSTEYDQYIIRSPVILNPDESVVFPVEIREGSKVQLIRRDEEKISRGAKTMAERVKSRLNGRKPMAVLHFECAARGKMFFGDGVKEKVIDKLQDVLGKDIPWLGLFCFGEIAPIKGKNYYHNQTAVLCVIYK